MRRRAEPDDTLRRGMCSLLCGESGQHQAHQRALLARRLTLSWYHQREKGGEGEGGSGAAPLYSWRFYSRTTPPSVEREADAGLLSR